MKDIKIGCNVLFPNDQSRKMFIDYDKEEDVLYIKYVESSQKADDTAQIGDYILRFFKNRVIGLTIINALRHIKANFTDAPSIFCDDKLIYA
jgi:uncharacterized protein YuzE